MPIMYEFNLNILLKNKKMSNYPALGWTMEEYIISVYLSHNVYLIIDNHFLILPT